MEPAAFENTLFALLPIKWIVPTTNTGITASITALLGNVLARFQSPEFSKNTTDLSPLSGPQGKRSPMPTQLLDSAAKLSFRNRTSMQIESAVDRAPLERSQTRNWNSGWRSCIRSPMLFHPTRAG